MKKLGMHQGRYLGMILLLTTSLAALGADVEFYGVVKMQRFMQSNATAPALAESESEDGEPPFVFNAFVDLDGSNSVTSAILTLPGGAQRTLQLEESGFNREFFDGAAFKPDLDLVFANGTYTLALQTQNDGNKSLPLTLPASDAYPNPPRISNFTAAQSVNAAQSFTLTWDAFAGGLATDFVQLEIMEPDTENTVFETSGPGEPGSQKILHLLRAEGVQVKDPVDRQFDDIGNFGLIAFDAQSLLSSGPFHRVTSLLQLGHKKIRMIPLDFDIALLDRSAGAAAAFQFSRQ
jgi:hypothetical protein